MQIISGEEARKSGMYPDSIFVLDKPEKDYDRGLWLISGARYAEWYSDFDALYTRIREKDIGR